MRGEGGGGGGRLAGSRVDAMCDRRALVVMVGCACLQDARSGLLGALDRTEVRLLHARPA